MSDNVRHCICCRARTQERRKERALIEASRPKRPPTKLETLDARKKGYRFMSDLSTEMALRWSLKQHCHSMKRIDGRCRWCVIERKVLTVGHMASKRPAPSWWTRFMLDWEKRSRHNLT